MKKKIISGLITGTLFIGVLTLTPSAQALDANTIASINQHCIYFDKVVFHVHPNLFIPAPINKVLSKKETRVMILPGPELNAKPRGSETQALVDALCAPPLPYTEACIHTVDNTIIDSVEFSADCDDTEILNLKAPAP